MLVRTSGFVLSLVLSLSCNRVVAGQQPSSRAQDIGDGKSAITAELNGPTSLAFDPTGNLYVVEMAGNRIRRIDAKSGMITTVIGHGEECLGSDCEYPEGLAGRDVVVGGLRGVVSDSRGVIYFSQIGKGLIRRIDPMTGKIESVSGVGILNSGEATNKLTPCFEEPESMTFDTDGRLLFTDTLLHVICRLSLSEHKVGVIAGLAGRGYGGDGGPAIQASFLFPMGLATDPEGNLLVADYQNHRVRRIDAKTGTINAIAGNGSQTSSGDGGPALAASILYPTAIGVDRRGNIYVSEGPDNSRIRKIEIGSGTIDSVYGRGDDSCREKKEGVSRHSLRAASGIAIDMQGNLFWSSYSCNRVYRLDIRSDKVTVFAGNGKPDRIDFVL